METGAGIRYRLVRTCETSAWPTPQTMALSAACNHCENARCMKACPVKAIYRKASDGIVEKKADFVPRSTFGTVGGNGKRRIYVPAFETGHGEPLPRWHPKRGEPDSTFPYCCLTCIPAVHKRNSTQNNAILNGMMNASEALINPKLAAKLGIRDGQRVLIRSRAGQVELNVKFTHIIRDGGIIPIGKIDDFVAANNFGGSSCIIYAVVNITPL
ncbi:MAG: hypothetical protein C0504_05645 [Candidatus Solibacter sp.]|nr:hypothetical protein [Candidatus Solibacter sp.]